jgi:hypothetical protein
MIGGLTLPSGKLKARFGAGAEREHPVNHPSQRTLKVNLGSSYNFRKH